MSGLLQGAVFGLVLLCGAYSETVSDPSQIFKPSPPLDPTGMSAKTASSAVLSDENPQAKSVGDSDDKLDAYKLFPPGFHQFLDLPIKSSSNDTGPKFAGTTKNSAKPPVDSEKDLTGNQVDSPDYNYYDTAGPYTGAGPADGNSNNNNPPAESYRDSSPKTSAPSKDQSYANYVASLTNKNQFGQQTTSQQGQNYDNHYDDEYEDYEREGNYGAKVSDSKKTAPSKSSSNSLYTQELQSPTGANKAKVAPKQSPNKSKPVPSNSQNNLKGNYYSDSGKSKFTPSQSSQSYSQETKPKVPLYSQPTPSVDSKNHYLPSFSSGKNVYSSPSSKQKKKPSYIPQSSPSESSGPSDDSPPPSAKPGKNNYNSKPSYSRPYNDDYSNEYDSNGKYAQSDDSDKAYGSDYDSYLPKSTANPLSKKPENANEDDHWTPIAPPSGKNQGSGNQNFLFPTPAPSAFDSGNSKPINGGPSDFDSQQENEPSEPESEDTDSDKPSNPPVDYDYYNEDNEGSSPPYGNQQKETSDQESDLSASGPSVDDDEPPRQNSPGYGNSFKTSKRPLKFPENVPNFPKGNQAFKSPSHSGKEQSAPMAEDFEYDEYSSGPEVYNKNKQPSYGSQFGRPQQRPGGRPFNDGPAFNHQANGNRPKGGKFNSPPGRRPNNSPSFGGGKFQDNSKPQSGSGGLSNEIPDDAFDFDDSEPSKSSFDLPSPPQRRPNKPFRRPQQGKLPGLGNLFGTSQLEDPKNYDDSEEYDYKQRLPAVKAPSKQRPSVGGRRPNAPQLALDDDDDDSFFAEPNNNPRPMGRRPNGRPNGRPGFRRPLNDNPKSGRKRPNVEAGEPSVEGDANSDAETEGLQIPDDYYEDAALEAMADVLLEDLDLEDSENGAPEPTANGGPPATAPAEFLQPGGYPSNDIDEDDEPSQSNPPAYNNRPSLFSFGFRGRGAQGQNNNKGGREQGFGPIFSALRGAAGGMRRPQFLRQPPGPGRRPFRRDNDSGEMPPPRRRANKRPAYDDDAPVRRRRPTGDRPHRRDPQFKRRKNAEAPKKRFGAGFAQRLFAGLRVPKPQIIPQLNVGPLGFILSKRSDRNKSREKRSLPPWVAHHALAPPQSVRNFINQFYNERSNVAKITQNAQKSKANSS